MPQIEREAGIQNERVTESKRVVTQKVGESERERGSTTVEKAFIQNA